MFIDLIFNYFSPTAFFQSILMAIFLFNLKKGSQKQNRLLALLLLSYGVLIGSRFIWHNLMLEEYRPVLTLCLDFRFVIGPLFYLYLKSIFKPGAKLKPADLLHAGVFVFVVISQNINKHFWLQPWKIFILIDMIQLALYIVWSFFEFKLISLFFKPANFKIDRRNIYWLQFFIISNILTLFILIFSWLLVNKILIVPSWNYWITRLFAFTNFIFINTIVFIALKIPDVFISIKYKNAELPDAIQQRYKAKLTGYMETNKPYLNPSLSLHSLSNQISISPKHLSQILNQSFQQTFYHYINSYRIEECQKMLSDKSRNHVTILDIAFEVGFNSKNSFNSAFKKISGMTPTEFRNRQANKQ